MTWWQRLRRGHRADEDLDRELRYHVDRLKDDEARAGASEAAAARKATLTFGGLDQVKEECRDVRTFVWLDRLEAGQRASRSGRFARHPGFTIVVLLIFALGIGANTTIFSVAYAVLLRPLPFKDPGRLVMLEERWLPRFPRFTASPLDFVSWREQTHAYEGMAAFVTSSFILAEDERPERIVGVRVSANLPQLLGVAPISGRSFRLEEDSPGANRVVLLGNGLWQRRFGADTRVVGTTVRLNGLPYTIIGIMPPEFRFPLDAEIWVPMGFTPEELASRGNHFVWAVGRLKTGVAPSQAQAELNLLMPQLQQNWEARVVPILDHYVGDVRPALVILLGSAALVLFIGCLNIAGLLLARSSSRQREISLRVALGAGRGRLVQQLVTETALLALVGGIAAIFVALGGITLIRNLPLAPIPRFDDVGIDGQILLFTFVLSTVTGVLVGLFPALRLSRSALHDALKAGSRAIGTEARTRVRNALTVAEVALALVLLVGAGLLFKSFQRLLDVKPGFDAENVVAATINLPATQYLAPYNQAAFVEELLQRLRNNPGIRAVSVSAGLPLSTVTDVGIRFDGRVGADAGTTANYYGVTADYFRSMQIPLIRGRVFAESDTASAPPVVVINETMAVRFFPNEDPLGKRLDISGPTFMREIVGVVGDVRQEGLRSQPPPQVYEPFLQKPSRSFNVVVRSLDDPKRVTDAVRQAVLTIDRGQPVSAVKTMNDAVSLSIARDRFALILLSAFAILALLLATAGVGGVGGAVLGRPAHERNRRSNGARRQSSKDLAHGAQSKHVDGIPWCRHWATGVNSVDALSRQHAVSGGPTRSVDVRRRVGVARFGRAGGCRDSGAASVSNRSSDCATHRVASLAGRPSRRRSPRSSGLARQASRVLTSASSTSQPMARS